MRTLVLCAATALTLVALSGDASAFGRRNRHHGEASCGAPCGPVCAQPCPMPYPQPCAAPVAPVCPQPCPQPCMTTSSCGVDHCGGCAASCGGGRQRHGLFGGKHRGHGGGCGGCGGCS